MRSRANSSLVSNNQNPFQFIFKNQRKALSKGELPSRKKSIIKMVKIISITHEKMQTPSTRILFSIHNYRAC